MGWGKFLGLISLLYNTQWVKLKGQGGGVRGKWIIRMIKVNIY